MVPRGRWRGIVVSEGRAVGIRVVLQDCWWVGVSGHSEAAGGCILATSNAKCHTVRNVN